MKEVYRARKRVIKVVNRRDVILYEGIVYLVKDGRNIIDCEQDMLVLPRNNFNKKGEFWDNFYVGTRNQCSKHYKILERVQ